jgi:Arc/MetJ-type ribon-helix-helix transcriptional regulator
LQQCSSALILATRSNTIFAKPYYLRIAMKTISIKLPDDLLAKIHAAKKRGETRSAFIRESVEESLSKEKNPSTGSCLDDARDLSGCVQGPPDLSMNPAHMDHYGR